VGPNSEFVAMTQGFEVNSTWIQFMLESNKESGQIVLQGQTWKIYENVRKSNPAKSKDYMMVLEYQDQVVFVYGVASTKQLEDFASQLTLAIEVD
jgi:hypothetical protein